MIVLVHLIFYPFAEYKRRDKSLSFLPSVMLGPEAQRASERHRILSFSGILHDVILLS